MVDNLSPPNSPHKINVCACASLHQVAKKQEQNGGIVSKTASFPFHETQKIMTDKTEETVEGTPLIEKDPVLVDINKKIVEAFDIFDHESNKTADVRYVHT